MHKDNEFEMYCLQALRSITHSVQPREIQSRNIDRWVASSLLQKAIRRGDRQHALMASLSLLQCNPAVFWRRLLIIVWEDIAYGDIEVCFAVTAATKSKKWRDEIGEVELGLALADRMCRATKNRVADDAITIVENDAAEFRAARSIAREAETALWHLSLPNDRCILKRSVAAWLLIGTKRIPSDFLPLVHGDTHKFFASFCEDQMSRPMQLFAADAVNRSRTLLPATIAMLEDDWRAMSVDGALVFDDLLATGTISGIPEYAFDGHTRAGCKYLGILSRADSDLFVWLQEHVPDEIRLPMLKKLFFRAVSAQCNRRQSWGQTELLRQRADSVGFLMNPAEFQNGLSIFRSALLRYPVREVLA